MSRRPWTTRLQGRSQRPCPKELTHRTLSSCSRMECPPLEYRPWRQRSKRLTVGYECTPSGSAPRTGQLTLALAARIPLTGAAVDSSEEASRSGEEASNLGAVGSAGESMR